MPTNWPDREDQFERHPGWVTLKWAFGIFAIVAALIVAGGIFGWWFDWGAKVGEVTGAQNTDAQFTALQDDYQSEIAAVQNYCAARDSDQGSTDGNVIVETPAFAYRARVLSIIADYNRRQDNWFEAGGLLISPDLPRHSPTLEQLIAQHC